jgi:hypothetical protein
MNMFVAQGKDNPDVENIRGLNLVAAKLTSIDVSKLPLWHKIRKLRGFFSPQANYTDRAIAAGQRS